MSDTGTNGSPILSLDAARKPQNKRSDLATRQDVADMLAAEIPKIHDFYLQQIPTFVARMIQDALLSYGLIVPQPGVDIAPVGAPAAGTDMDNTAGLQRGDELPPTDTAPTPAEPAS